MKTLLFLFLAASACCGTPDDAVLLITGASCMEELSEDAVSRFRHYAGHPIDLNSAPEGMLVSSGLMSRYQAASITEYRERSGDILSFSELGLVDGFSPEYAQALSHFTVLRSRSVPGQTKRKGVRGSLTAATAAETRDGGMRYKYRLRLDASLDERYGLRLNNGIGYSDPEPGKGTMSLSYSGRSGRLALGHFNARFGQGLVLWSGFSMGGYPSISSFSRNGSGLSPTSSASAELFGAAATAYAGKSEVSFAWSVPTKDVIFNYSLNKTRFNAGITANTAAASVDMRLSIRHLSLFGETAMNYRNGPAAAGGLLWVPAYGKALALHGRYFAPAYGEYSNIAAGMQLGWMYCSLDLSSNTAKGRNKARLLLLSSRQFDVKGFTLKPSFRGVVSRTFPEQGQFRTDLRLDMGLAWRSLQLNMRANLVVNEALASLCFVETAYSDEKFGIYLKTSLFDIEKWEDRIYSYERSAPGSFSIPAYYGKGLAGSAYIVWKPGNRARRFRFSLWFKATYVHYAPESHRQPDKTEMSLQCRLEI